jgi:single-stranded-DNA-specific exonuclease
MGAPARVAAARWNLPNPDNSVIEALRQSLGIQRAVAAVLVHRGYDEPGAARDFLSSKLSALEDPFQMRDMEQALTRLFDAIKNGEPILIYGDYDVDGTSSIVVLKKAIEILGGSADFFIPHRLKDGYGMRNDALDCQRRHRHPCKRRCSARQRTRYRCDCYRSPPA